MTRHATMTNRNDIQYSMHVLAMTWSSTTPPLGVSDTHTCSPSSEDPHNVPTVYLTEVCTAALGYAQPVEEKPFQFDPGDSEDDRDSVADVDAL